MSNIKIEPGWKTALAPEFEKPYFQHIRQFLVDEKAAGKTIYPPGSLIFNAFNSTPIDKVRVVILGQDPYHNPGEAMGLCFSVPRGIRIPPSLLNIYKEIHQSLQLPIPKHGDLSTWSAQGVLLLNAMLTVEAHSPASHKSIGWQTFTDAVIQTISEQKQGIIFLLWGNFAKGKKSLIDATRHHILEAPHPSPLAQGFIGCKHFVRTNELLSAQGQPPIDWSIPD